jgi:hypothetical protein
LEETGPSLNNQPFDLALSRIVTELKAAVMEVDLLLEFFLTMLKRGSVHEGSRFRIREVT